MSVVGGSSTRFVRNTTESEIAVFVLDPGTWPRFVNGRVIQDEPRGVRRIAGVAPGAVFEVPRQYDNYPMLVMVPEHAMFGVTVSIARGV